MKRSVLGFIFACSVLGSNVGHAGWLIAPNIRWTNFAMEPIEEEDTPNYFSYGLGLSAGYSVGQVVDFALVGQYMPGHLEDAKVGPTANSTLAFGGGELAFRIARTIYLGFRGGVGQYEVPTQTIEGEVVGTWQGTGGGISLGAIFKVSKRIYWQTSVDFMHIANMTPTAGVDTSVGTIDPRSMNAISINLAWVYNGFKNTLIENTIFKDFLDTIIFDW